MKVFVKTVQIGVLPPRYFGERRRRDHARRAVNEVHKRVVNVALRCIGDFGAALLAHLA
jgi:hypothetical protein